jgi:hypothetical protein
MGALIKTNSQSQYAAPIFKIANSSTIISIDFFEHIPM